MSIAVPTNNTPDDDTDTPTAIQPGARRAWEARGSGVYVPSSNLSRLDQLPPAIYRFVETQTGWFLSAIAERFAFPFRLYETHDAIVTRVLARFASTSGNTGAMFNGEKGAGKTVAVQLIANQLLGRGLPVLVVDSMIPLAPILESIEQDCVVIFDEFEKVYRKTEDQASILTTIDGMGRSAHRRLFLFTTNTSTVDPNFIDRPSRIAYIFEFGRLDTKIVEQIVDSELDPSKNALRDQLVDFLLDRRTLTIDVARAATREVNLFGELAFDGYFNASDSERSFYDLHLLDDAGNLVKVLMRGFDPRPSDVRYLRRHLQPRTAASIRGEGASLDFYVRDHHDEGVCVHVLGYAELLDPTEIAFKATLTLPNHMTWRKAYKNVFESDSSSNIDARPEGWTVPSWVIAEEAGKRLTAAQKAEKDAFRHSWCHGRPSVLQVLNLRFVPVRRQTAKPGVNMTGIEF